jgi:hypothetical protein
MLESVKKAFDNGLFNQSDSLINCPVELEDIETYIIILKPAYLFSIYMQKTNSSISGVIPGIAGLYQH